MRTAVVLMLLTLSCIGHAQVLAQPRASVAIVYGGGESTGPVEIRRAVAALEHIVQVEVFAPGSGGRVLQAATDLGRFDAVFVDGTTDGIADFRELLAETAAATRLIVVDPPSGVAGNVDLGAHPDVHAYWSHPSQDNYAALVHYIVARVLEHELPAPFSDVPAPIRYPAAAYYHPDATGFFESLADLQDWQGRNATDGSAADEPVRIGIAFHRNYYLHKNTAHVDELVRRIEARGHAVVPIMSDGAVDFDGFLVEDGQPAIDAVLFLGSSLDFLRPEEGRAQARRLGVQVLGAIAHSGLTPEQYAASDHGLAPDMSTTVVNQERDGVFEPMVIAGRSELSDERYFVAPMDDEIEWRVERAIAWAKLRRGSNAVKRIVFTYWSESGGKADLGGDPDDFLDVPASLIELMGAMRERGYDLGADPLPDRDELARRMVAEGANVGNWAPGELARLVESSQVELLPARVYRQWFDALPPERRAEIEALWGPPPGNVMSVRDEAGEQYLVIPKLEYGNVLIAPHPVWGYLENERAMMSREATPPHHQYLAFFLWLQREWGAHAWVSLFSNIVLQPAKSEGPLADDHVGILLGGLPHIHPERLGASGGISNKRKALAHTPGWYSVVVPAGELEALQPLTAQLARYETLATDSLRSAARQSIRDEIEATGFDRTLGVDASTVGFEELVAAAGAKVDELARAYMPQGSKVLGEAAAGHAMTGMVKGMLGAELPAALAGRDGSPDDVAIALTGAVLAGESPKAAVERLLGAPEASIEALLAPATDYAARLAAAPREVQALLEALDGRWLEPGPIDEPMRRPDSVPPGRALFHFDPAAMPTQEAEIVGRAQAEAMIERYVEEHGEFPRQLAFVLFSSDTTRNQGVTEAQVLHLLGTRPVRNARDEVIGVDLIPRETLGRPRVDVLVTTSGTYRDHFPGKMDLITEAVGVAAASTEADNAVAVAVAAAAETFMSAGYSAPQAARMARTRVFSEAPGAYSPNIQFLAKSGDQRGDERRMANLYLDRVSHAYGGGNRGEPQRSVFENNLSRTSAAVLPRSSSVNGMLDHPMSAAYLGGLNMAVEAVRGEGTELYVSDLRDPARPAVSSAADAIQAELRTRYFNPEWIRLMMGHGYEGARNFMFMTDHLDLWSSTASHVVGSGDWAEIKSVYLDDRFDLRINEFFDAFNPYAQQVLLANLLGAAERGHWQADAAELEEVARRLVESTLEHGSACEASLCRNPGLTGFIEQSLAAAVDAAPLMEAYRAVIEQAVSGASAAVPAEGTVGSGEGAPGQDASPAASVVTGRVMESSLAESALSERQPIRWRVVWLALFVVVSFAAGWRSAAKNSSTRKESRLRPLPPE